VRFLNNTAKTISINDLRRRFGEIEKELPFRRFILTKKGRPFAMLSAAPSVKKELLKATAGSLKNTTLDNDNIWREVLKRKSRAKNIIL